MDIVIARNNFLTLANVNTPQTLQEAQRWVPEKNNEKNKIWGMLPNSQHFKGRRACQSSMMGLE
jgi:hypothetical protein